MSAAGERQAGEAGRSFALSLAAIAAAAAAVILAAAALWAVHPSGPGGGGSAERADQDVQHRARRPVGAAVIDLGYLRTTVVLQVASKGAMRHDLQLEGGSTCTGMLSSGTSRTVSHGHSAAPSRPGAPYPGTRPPG